MEREEKTTSSKILREYFNILSDIRNLVTLLGTSVG